MAEVGGVGAPQPQYSPETKRGAFWKAAGIKIKNLTPEAQVKAIHKKLLSDKGIDPLVLERFSTKVLEKLSTKLSNDIAEGKFPSAKLEAIQDVLQKARGVAKTSKKDALDVALTALKNMQSPVLGAASIAAGKPQDVRTGSPKPVHMRFRDVALANWPIAEEGRTTVAVNHKKAPAGATQEVGFVKLQDPVSGGQLILAQGDVTQKQGGEEVDAAMNAANDVMYHGGGGTNKAFSAVIPKEHWESEVKQWKKDSNKGQLEVSECAVMKWPTKENPPKGEIHPKVLIQVLGPVVDPNKLEKHQEEVYLGYKNLFAECKARGLTSIQITGLSTGIYAQKITDPQQRTDWFDRVQQALFTAMTEALAEGTVKKIIYVAPTNMPWSQYAPPIGTQAPQKAPTALPGALPGAREAVPPATPHAPAAEQAVAKPPEPPKGLLKPTVAAESLKAAVAEAPAAAEPATPAVTASNVLLAGASPIARLRDLVVKYSFLSKNMSKEDAQILLQKIDPRLEVSNREVSGTEKNKEILREMKSRIGSFMDLSNAFDFLVDRAECQELTYPEIPAEPAAVSQLPQDLALQGRTLQEKMRNLVKKYESSLSKLSKHDSHILLKKLVPNLTVNAQGEIRNTPMNKEIVRRMKREMADFKTLSPHFDLLLIIAGY